MYQFNYECTWQDVRSAVRAVNEECAHIIDEISPPSSLKLYKLSYHFGDMLYQRGQLSFPKDTAAASLQHIMHQKISPVGLVLSKGVEVSIEAQERLIPLAVLSAGSVFGMEVLEQKKNS